MEDVEQTKLRLIREAIQDNIQRKRGSKTRELVRRPRTIPLWLWGVSLLASLAYLSGPRQVVSRAKFSPPVASASSTDMRSAQRVAPDFPEPPPQALNRALFPLSVKKIVIDPGHGGRQQGTASQSGVSEKDITLDIALRLRRLLENESFDVLVTRETDNTVGLERRAEFANAHAADLFVSIHVNWIQPRKVRAVETYFLGPTDDPAATKLVAMEDRDSGYSLAEYRNLLEKVYMDTRRDESRKLAKAVQSELYGSLSRINPGLEDRGVKTAPFIVLIRTQMPAILVEVSCLSNEEEVKLLTSGDYKETIAQALSTGMRSYASKLNGSPEKVVKNGRNE
jgi:N-acetylmuramoyl-L-alanine amidase